MKSLKIIMGFILPLTFLTYSPSQASAAEIQPFINYATSSVLKFQAVPAQWSTPGVSKYQWFVNGKAVAGATKLSFSATQKSLGQKIQFEEVRSGVTSQSVTAKIGQVIVNVKPKVLFSGVSGDPVTTIPGVVSPKTSKATYQWYKGPIDIPGAKSANYQPATGDQGFKV